MRRWQTLLAACLLSLLALTGAMVGTTSAASSITSIAAALTRSPVYVDPGASVQVDAVRVKAVIARDTYLAVLPATAVPPGSQPDELPALLSGQVGKGGTVVVLVGTQLYGASTTLPGRLGSELATAQSGLSTNPDAATGTLVALMRSLSGSGDLQDAAGPARAGGPVGGAILIAFAIVAVFAALALWWWLRRKPTARRLRPASRPRDLVEIDYDGKIIKRTPASDRQP